VEIINYSIWRNGRMVYIIKCKLQKLQGILELVIPLEFYGELIIHILLLTDGKQFKINNIKKMTKYVYNSMVM